MTEPDYSDRSPEAMERRQAARLAMLEGNLEHEQSPAARYRMEIARWHREGRDGFPPPPPAEPAAVRPPTQDERDTADGLVFSVRDRCRAEAETDHRARRRRADAELASSERLHRAHRESIRDAFSSETTR